jgi:hypothetical protein
MVMDFRCYIVENAAKIMIAVGIAFLLLGVLTLTTFFSFIPMFSLFLGFMLLVLGVFTHVGLFSIEWRSTNGLAVILLCVSLAFFVLAIVSIQFQEVSSTYGGSVRFDGDGSNFPSGLIHSSWLTMETERPFLPLFIIGAQVGLAFFVACLAVKACSYLRYQ